MKLPVIDRFQKQNYSNAPDWFTRFLNDMNQFTETVWNILNKNLTIEDNLDSQVYRMAIRAGATAADNATSFITTLKHAPQAVLVGQVTDQEAYQVPLTAAVGVQWTFSGSTISITSISGLIAGQTYNLTLVIF